MFIHAVLILFWCFLCFAWLVRTCNFFCSVLLVVVWCLELRASGLRRLCGWPPSLPSSPLMLPSSLLCSGPWTRSHHPLTIMVSCLGWGRLVCSLQLDLAYAVPGGSSAYDLLSRAPLLLFLRGGGRRPMSLTHI